MRKNFIIALLLLIASALYSQTKGGVKSYTVQTAERITYMDSANNLVTVNAEPVGYAQTQITFVEHWGSRFIMYESYNFDGTWTVGNITTLNNEQSLVWNDVMALHPNFGSAIVFNGKKLLKVFFIPSGKSSPLWWTPDGKSFFIFWRLYRIVE